MTPKQPRTLLLAVSVKPVGMAPMSGIPFSAPVLTGTPKSPVTQIFRTFPHVKEVLIVLDDGFVHRYMALPEGK